MCGIAGLFAPDIGDDGVLRRRAEAMADAIRLRGPDAGGVWVDPSAGLALGHRRLAIIDLSPMGAQPMVSPSGRYAIAYNGEIYNYQELRADLEARGQTFRGHSDTETLLAGIDCWGLEATLARCVGMFAFALWDGETRRLTFARDRMGEKPLYLARVGGAILFASELKALRADPAFDPPVDRGALGLFLRYGYVPAPWSIYENTRKLPPGALLTLDADAARAGGDPLAGARAYWSAAEVARAGLAEPFAGDAAAAEEELDALIARSVRQCMVSDAPLGAFLSGGVDSATVVAHMQRAAARPVRTFTIGFSEPRWNEAEHAAAVARHLGTDHTELYVSADDARAVAPDMATLYDEPFADASQIPTFLVARMARAHVTVSLSGDGGDELFAGYTRYADQTGGAAAALGLPGGLRRALGRGARGLGAALVGGGGGAGVGAAVAAGMRLERLAAHLACDDRARLYMSRIAHWPGAEALLRDAPPARAIVADRGAGGLPESAAAAISDPALLACHLDQQCYLPDDILVKVDRATMGVSLESRAPLLDHRLVAFAWRLPMAYKMRDGVGKWLLRRALDRHAPRALIERPKQGFTPPLGAWIDGPLRDWAEALLEPARLEREGFFDARAVSRRWTARAQVGGGAFWGLLMFQAWREAARAR